MMKPIFPRILTTTALCLAAGACVSYCYAEPEQTVVQQRRGKPTHEEVRRKHIAQAREKLARCRERLENLNAEVEIYGPGQEAPPYPVKADDMPRLRYIVSQLQANPDFSPVRVRMRHSRRLFCLNLDFGEGVKLSLRAERITTPGGTGIGHIGSLYALPTPELRRELTGIIERALPPKN